MSHRLNCHIKQRQSWGTSIIVHASSNFLIENIEEKDYSIRRNQDYTMKNKSKKEDEGSTQSNASRYDPIPFLLLFFFDCLPCQAWLITSVNVCNVVLYKVDHCHEWPCYCLIATPWFSYHFLGPNAEVSGLMFDCPQGLCVTPEEKSCPLTFDNLCHKCLMSIDTN